MTAILLVEVLDRRCGLPASVVQSLQRAVTVVPLPSAPDVVEGLIDVHGKLVPVFELRRRLRLPPKEIETSDHLVIAEAGGRLVALRVDSALELVEVDERDLEDPRLLAPGAEHVAGVARLAGGIVLIHDLATFLSQAESAQLDEALRKVPL